MLRAETVKIGGLPVSEQIMVDQFGFRPQSEKIVIFASPQEGQNAGTKYTPPAKASVRCEKGGKAVLTVALEPWGGGQTDKTSGDKVWYADISALKAPGDYYVYDAENRVRSYGFRVADDVYLPVLKAAVRAFFYQRCGGAVPAANGGTWHHPACHLASGQDKAAQLYIDGQTKGQARDVHGGWHDAGDYNKYVPFTLDVVIPLLMAYELNPSVFGDDWNIPESGNGIPDMLDELRWECDWLMRMQMPDGSVCNRVTERTSLTGVPPDQDTKHERYYTQPTSWATATLAADLACFSRVIGEFPAGTAYARKCRAAARKAWAWLEQHPEMTPADGKDHGRPSEAADAACDNGKAGDTERRVLAAVQLWMLDPQPKYEAFFKKWRKEMLAPSFVEYALSPKADKTVADEVRAALKEVPQRHGARPAQVSHRRLPVLSARILVGLQSDEVRVRLPGDVCREARRQSGRRRSVPHRSRGLLTLLARSQSPVCGLPDQHGAQGRQGRGGQEHYAALPHVVLREQPLVRPRLARPGAGAAGGRTQYVRGSLVASAAGQAAALEVVQGLGRSLEPGTPGNGEFLGVYRARHLLPSPLRTLALAVCCRGADGLRCSTALGSVSKGDCPPAGGPGLFAPGTVPF